MSQYACVGLSSARSATICSAKGTLPTWPRIVSCRQKRKSGVTTLELDPLLGFLLGSKLGERLPATIELAVAALSLSLLVALPAGTLAAASRGTWVDRATTLLALVGSALPSFWLGPLLALTFGVVLGWLPVAGRGGASYLVLPALTARRACPRDCARYGCRRSVAAKVCAAQPCAPRDKR